MIFKPREEWRNWLRNGTQRLSLSVLGSDQGDSDF
jgi:hypothetical protein